MARIEQGDILKVAGFFDPVIVVSNNYFNRSGCVIVCPITQKAVPGPLHIELNHEAVQGLVLCEQVKFLDLSARRYAKVGSAKFYDVMDLSDAVTGIFDYQESEP